MIRLLTALLLTLQIHAYNSQCGQDQFVHEHYFCCLKGGAFVDIGAHDGISLSNTYFLEKEMGWTGLCIEPIPKVFAELKKNRKATCIQGCVSDRSGPSQFLKITGPIEMLSGLVDRYDPRHLERVRREVSSEGGSYETIDVQCYRFNDLLEQNGIKHVHFLSIDTEGGEFEIISSIDFDRFEIDVMTIENNYNDPRFTPYLAEQGFRFVRSLDQDMIFINEKFYK